MVLRKRYRRNIKSNLSFFISIIILTAVSIMVYLTMACGFENMNAYIQDFKRECAVEDAQFTVYSQLSDEEIAEFEERFDLLIEQQAYIDMDGSADGQEDTIRLLRNTEKVNLYRVTKGSDISGEDEILLSSSYITANSLQIGDTYELGGKTYTIAGEFARPDYLYILREIKGSFATPETFGIAMVSDDEYSRICEELAEDEVSYYGVKYRNKDNINSFRKALNEKAVVSAYIINKNNNRISTADNTLQMTKDIKDVIVPIVFVLIVFIIAVVLERKIKSEEKLIGILSANGYTKLQLALHYSFFGVITAILGSILGVALSVPMENVLIPMAFVKLESLPVEYGLSPSSVVISFVFPFICFTGTVFLTSLMVMRKKTISMITGADDGSKKLSLRLERSKLSLVSKYRIRSVVGKPFRTVIIVVGVCIGSLIFLYTYGCADSLKVYVDESIEQIGDFEYQYYFNQFRTDKTDEGLAVIYSNYECGKDDTAVMLMGMEDNDVLCHKLVSGEEADIDGGGYYLSKMGSIVYGVHEGDELTLKNIATLEKTTIRIDGILDNNVQNVIYTSPENVYELTGFPEGSYNLLISKEPHSFSDGETRQIITKDSLRSQIHEVYEVMKSEVSVMIPFGILICVFVIYIIVNMLISESTASISMFKVLGYKDRDIDRLIINVYHIVIPIAALVGLAAGYIFVEEYFQANADAFNAYIKAHLSPVTCIKYCLLVFFSYIASLLLLKRKVGKVEMTESLKDNRV